MHTRDGREFTKAPNGHVASFKGPNGHEAHFGADGKVREVHTKSMTITHGPGGARRVVVERPGHTTLVANARGGGYIQKPYMYNGHPYLQRNYYYHGVAYSRVYRPYYYNGVYLQGYVPYRYYSPAFYGWAYAPWAAPVPYAWGWAGNPWYGYYGAYFAPYPVYPSASLWLTDYLISASLQQAYQEGVAAGAAGATSQVREPRVRLVYASYVTPAGGGGNQAPALTPEVKQAIAEEVERDLAAEKAQGQTVGQSADASGGGLAQLLGDGKPHVFVASTTVNASPATGDCSITEGDVLQMSQPPAAKATTADMRVLASKTQDCQQGSVVPVSLQDLQEMQNHLMATVDQGLGEIQKNPGKGGMPAPPAAALQGETDAPYVAAAPKPDPNGAADLKEASQEAEQTEQQVLAEATPPPDANGEEAPAEQVDSSQAPAAQAPAVAAAPVTIAVGQTPAQVLASKGKPSQIVNLGSKQIYVYPDVKITFIGGKLTDAQ